MVGEIAASAMANTREGRRTGANGDEARWVGAVIGPGIAREPGGQTGRGDLPAAARAARRRHRPRSDHLIGSTCVCSIRTARSARGFNPSRLMMVGAIRVVSTGTPAVPWRVIAGPDTTRGT